MHQNFYEQIPYPCVFEMYAFHDERVETFAAASITLICILKKWLLLIILVGICTLVTCFTPVLLGNLGLLYQIDIYIINRRHHDNTVKPSEEHVLSWVLKLVKCVLLRP